MRWRKSSEHSIVSECGRFHIARLMSGGKPGYLLWDGQKLIPGCSEDPEVRKRDADAIANASRNDLKGSRSSPKRKLVSAHGSG